MILSFVELRLFFFPQAYFSQFSKGWVLVGNLIHMFMIHFSSTPFKFIFGAWVGTWEAFKVQDFKNQLVILLAVS